MITKAKIINDINYIHDDTPVAFKNFGGFFLKLMMFPVEDQEFIVDSLMKAVKRMKPSTGFIVIYSIDRVKTDLKKNEQHFRFILEYEFSCRWCHQICKEEINIGNKKFKDVCEACFDTAMERQLPEIRPSNNYD